MGSTPTYSTVALRASFTIPPPYLSPTSLPVSSVPSYHNKGENDKKTKKKHSLFFGMESLSHICNFICDYNVKTLQNYYLFHNFYTSIFYIKL